MKNNENKYICPNCKNDNIQKLELIYLNGMNDVDGTGIGVGRGGFFGGWYGGKSQSRLSQAIEPPKYHNLILGFLGRGIVLYLFYYFLICNIFKELYDNNTADNIARYVIWGVSGLIVIYDLYYNIKLLSKIYASWKRKYMCYKCGQIFEIIKKRLGYGAIII